MGFLSWHFNIKLLELPCNLQYTGKTIKSYDQQLDKLSKLPQFNYYMGLHTPGYNIPAYP